MRQRGGTAAIFVAAAMCLIVAAIGAYARYAILDEGRFADRATGTLSSDEVRDEVAARIGARVVAAQPQLATEEAAVEDALADQVLTEPAFHAAFRVSAARLHRVVFSDADAEASLVVPGAGEALRQELLARMPERRGRLGRIPDSALMTIGTNAREHRLRALAPRAADAALALTIAALVAALALLCVGAARAGSARTAVWACALAVAAAAGATAAGVTAGRDIVLTHFDTSVGDAVVTQIWNAYLGDLRTWGLALCAACLLVAAAAGAPRLSARTMLAPPATPGGRLGRAAALLAVAWLAVQVPELVLHVALVTVAAALVYVAAGDVLRAIAPPRPATPRLPRPAAPARAGGTARADSSTSTSR